MAHGWNTKKVEGGVEWNVYSVEYNQPVTIIQSGTRKTRAQAAGMAKKLVRYYRAQGK